MPWAGPGIPEVSEAEWAAWARGAHFRASEFLFPIRDAVLAHAKIGDGEVVLDVGAGDGLIGFAALERVGVTGRVIFSDVAQPLVDDCREEAERRGVLDRCAFVRAAVDDLSAIVDESVDVVTARSVLHCVTNEARRTALREFRRVLRPAGRFSCFDPINGYRHKVPEPAHLLRGYDVSPVLAAAGKVRNYLARVRPLEAHTSLSFDERDLVEWAEQAGFARVELEYRAKMAPAEAGRPAEWETWVHRKEGPSPGGEVSLAEAMAAVLTPQEADAVVNHLRPLVEAGATAPRISHYAEAYLWGVK